jgi:hypothetical protein
MLGQGRQEAEPLAQRKQLSDVCDLGCWDETRATDFADWAYFLSQPSNTDGFMDSTTHPSRIRSAGAKLQLPGPSGLVSCLQLRLAASALLLHLLLLIVS